MNSTGQPAIVSVRRLANATPEVEVRQAFARVTSSTCLNSRVYRELLAQGYDTLVLNYEAPNPNPNPNPYQVRRLHLRRARLAQAALPGRLGDRRYLQDLPPPRHAH